MPAIFHPSTHLQSLPTLQRLRGSKMLVHLLQAALLTVLLASAHAQNGYSPAAPLDPPARVAWLGLAEGEVSFAPADADNADESGGWQPALLNRPLVAGERLWSAARARTELHIGSTAVRMAHETGLDFVALDDNRIQLRLVQGTIQLRVRTLFDSQRLEIDTPNLAFIITQPGNYRLDVDPARDTSRVVVQSGGGWLYDDNGQSLPIDGGEQGSFSSTDLTPAAPGSALQDRFDQWTTERDHAEDQSVSARYVPRETVGYQQLDHYGDWQQDAAYGAVWLPRSLPENWAPYRTGLWRWVSPWGWTWIDEAPWGFAPFHYGRWAQIGPRWAWVPGRLPQRPVYAPALVAFVGDPGHDNARPLGWFPLAPGEAFRPTYRSSPHYLDQLNHNMAMPQPSGAGTTYRYQRQPDAVSALSREDFSRGRPVRGHLQPFSSSELNLAPTVTDHRTWLPRPTHDDLPRRLPPAVQPPLTSHQPPVIVNPPPVGRDTHDRRPWPLPGRTNEPQREPHTPRSGRTETGRPEAGRPETGRPEAGRPEAGRPEAGRPEPTGRTPRSGATPTPALTPTPAPPQAAPAPATPVNRRPPVAGTAPALPMPALPPVQPSAPPPPVLRTPPVPVQNTGTTNPPAVRRDPQPSQPQPPSQREPVQRPPTGLPRPQDTQPRHTEDVPVQRPQREHDQQPPRTTAPAQPHPAPVRENPQPVQRKPQAQEGQATPPTEAGRPQRRRPEDEPRQPREP